ncbi:MAG: hypothetical protein N2422_03540 [Rhodobacteraceae bacterium]|nr:hypothetical protein [Paracoccaceae bacterium]
MADLPELYFRIRENGATVFRVETSARDGRTDLEPLAAVNVRNGEIRPQGDRQLSGPEMAAIRDWLAGRRAVLAAREADEIRRTVEHLNLTAHWAQTKATEDEVEAVTDSLLLAMHDLRMVLVRRRAERLSGGG